MPRRTKSTRVNRKCGSKSIYKLPTGSKLARQRRSFAGCIGCRTRGKKCDQQQLTDGEGFATCRWCHEHGIPCTGGFGLKKISGLDDRWRELFCVRVKLYMKETGQARGIPGWKRSDSLRTTRLSRHEVAGYILSHYDLAPEDEEEHHNCIYSPNGICQLLPLARPLDVSLVQSPSSFEGNSEFGSPFLSQNDIGWSPLTVTGEFGEPPHFVFASVNEINGFTDTFDLGSFPVVAEEVEIPSDTPADMEQAKGAYSQFSQGILGHEPEPLRNLFPV